MTLRAERQSAPMSKITNDRLIRSGTRMLCSCSHMATVGIKGLIGLIVMVSSYSRTF